MSAPEPCPECKGRCCWDEYFYRIEHMAAELYSHQCEACEDGTKYVPPRLAVRGRTVEEAMSAPEPCSECKGRCCWDEYFYRIEHMAAELYSHQCEACEDGTKYVPPRTVLDERRDVLAWLADQARLPGGSPDEKNMLNWVARAIYGMEHVGAATKGKP